MLNNVNKLNKPTLVLATFALAMASFMNVLDSTVVNTAISSIAGNFAVPYSQGTWAITSYAVSEAIMLPLTGWLTVRFGMLRQFVWATLLFTVASILCGISQNMEMLLAARILQGIVGASMIPLSQSLLMTLYPPEKRGLAIGVWAMTVVLAPIAGPILGGWLTYNASWRWAFYINVPIGIFSALTVHFIFKKQGWMETVKKVPVDVFGLICLVIAVGSLQLMLDKGSEYDWFSSNLIIVLAIISFIFIVLFLIWESYQLNPIVDLKYFKNRSFVSGLLCLSIGSTAFFATVVILPIWLQNFLGYTPYESGLTTATTSIFIVVLAPIIGANSHKVDARKMVAFGFFIFFLASCAISNLPPDVTQSHIAFVRSFLGIGLAFFFIPLNNILLGGIPDREVPAASGISNFMRNLGNSFGTSLTISYWERLQVGYHEQMVSNIQSSNQAFNSFSNMFPGTIQENLTYINFQINSQAALMGINHIMLLSGFIMLGLIPVVFIAKKSNKVVVGH